ncbi:MAG: aromatic amino acid hydroxylase [Deltaproteobacteria bacterium]|nr:aromatic amino acid hydroxylase [Deltaproteobacteria bacterium]
MESLPQHLKKYIVQQDDQNYSPMDQAVWRYILRQLKNFLKSNAYTGYIEGLEKLEITPDEIPLISNLSQKLERFGWRALPVSGFIPPAAFMELQSLSVLPIASDIRSLEHLLYTPAPDIVHEAAGHAPFLIHADFSNYLKKYAQVARKALISKEDLDLYEAIRLLSDIKENPTSSKEQITKAEENLVLKSKAISHISEAAELGRMNWWTAEYGLIGEIQNPKIYGAGLLSSVGESRWCLSSKVKKIPFTIDCLKYSYDITEPQPQLFVTPDFLTLEKVLEQMAEAMAFKTGGVESLEKALKSGVVNSFEVDSLVQIGGQLEKYCLDVSGNISFLKFKGPTQIAVEEKELMGHDKVYHNEGFSTPLGMIKGFEHCPSDFTDSDWVKVGLELGKKISLEFQSGFKVEGIYLGRIVLKQKTILLKFKEATATYNSEVVFQPEWGYYDMVLGQKITSVYSGPPDRLAYGEIEDFIAMRVQKPILTDTQKQIQELYSEIRYLRKFRPQKEILTEALKKHFKEIKNLSSEDWLLPLEIYELVSQESLDNEFSHDEFKCDEFKKEVLTYLKLQTQKLPQYKSSIEDGIALSTVQ